MCDICRRSNVQVMRFFEEADDDNSGEINVDEFITVIKSILARIAEGTFDEEEIKDSREEIRIISEEEEALLNVWAIVTNRSTGNILKKRMLRLIETNFKARRLLRRVHPDFETACRQKFFSDILLLHNAPHYGDKFWLKQKHLKFGKVDQGEFIAAALHSLKQYRKQKVAKAQLKRVLLIQKITRGFITRRKRRRILAAVKIQSCYRCYVARKRVARIWQIRREEASTLIQKIIRGYLGRKTYKRWWSSREIQRVWRGFTGRQKVKELKGLRAQWGV